MHAHTHMRTCVCVCAGQKSPSGVFLNIFFCNMPLPEPGAHGFRQIGLLLALHTPSNSVTGLYCPAYFYIGAEDLNLGPDA